MTKQKTSELDDAWRAASAATGLGGVRTLLNKYDKEENERMALGMVKSATFRSHMGSSF